MNGGGAKTDGPKRTGRVEAGEITSFREYHGSHSVTNAGNRSNWRIEFIHNGLDLHFISEISESSSR